MTSHQPLPGVKPGPLSDALSDAVRKAYTEGQRVGRTLALRHLRAQVRACRTLDDVLGLLDLQVAGVPVLVRGSEVTRAA